MPVKQQTGLSGYLLNLIARIIVEYQELAGILAVPVRAT
jgi:hypothetical protein